MIAADQEPSKRDLGPHRKRVEFRVNGLSALVEILSSVEKHRLE